jgi:hypothetical protein
MWKSVTMSLIQSNRITRCVMNAFCILIVIWVLLSHETLCSCVVCTDNANYGLLCHELQNHLSRYFHLNLLTLI